LGQALMEMAGNRLWKWYMVNYLSVAALSSSCLVD
jgi:hypothetical protein